MSRYIIVDDGGDVYTGAVLNTREDVERVLQQVVVDHGLEVLEDWEVVVLLDFDVTTGPKLEVVTTQTVNVKW